MGDLFISDSATFTIKEDYEDQDKYIGGQDDVLASMRTR